MNSSAIRHPSVRDGTRRVDAAAGRGDPAVDVAEQVIGSLERHVGSFQSAGALDPNLIRAVDKHIGNVRGAHQVAEWSVTIDVIGQRTYVVAHRTITPLGDK